jgi:hypothetical protein
VPAEEAVRGRATAAEQPPRQAGDVLELLHVEDRRPSRWWLLCSSPALCPPFHHRTSRCRKYPSGAHTSLQFYPGTNKNGEPTRAKTVT